MKTPRKAICPGSYDPITKGHEDIILRAAQLFDEVIVAMGINSTKKYLFDEAKRLAYLQKTFEAHANIKVVTYSGLTVDYCRTHEIGWIVRGVRNPIDMEYEKAIAVMNQNLYPAIETVFFQANPLYSSLSSTIVREIHINGGDIQPFIPVSL